MNGDKLSELMARNSNVAVIFRRGPSKWYHVMKWDLHTDSIEHGSWFKGRIYEHVSDISNDGKYLLYSVFQGSRLGSSYTDSYTGLSLIPWLKALALWPQGSTYLAGGVFVNDNTIAKWALPFCQNLHAEHTDLRDFEIINATAKHQSKWHENQNIIDDADWSRLDHKGRTLWHKGYQLYVTDGDKTLMLKDFSKLKPKPLEAPY
jgi:hypothetical protein